MLRPHGERRRYLLAIKDASTNEIVAWALSETIGMLLVMEMLGKLDSIDWPPHVPHPFRPEMPLRLLRIQEAPLRPSDMPIHVEGGTAGTTP